MIPDSVAVVVAQLGAYAAAVSSSRSLPELVMAVERVIDVFLQTEYTGLYLYHPDTKTLTLHHARGFSENERQLAEQSAMQRHPGKVFREKKMIYVPDVKTDLNNETIDSPRSFTVRSRLYLPILNNDECLGAFGVVSSQSDRFSSEDIIVFTFVCNLAGVAYGNYLNELKRKEIEQKFLLRDRAIASSTDGIIITDALSHDNPVIYVNKGFENITQYSFNDVIGKNIRFLQGEDKDQLGLQQLRNAMKTHSACTVVMKNYRKDGIMFWCELSITPVFDEEGILTNYIGIQHDVTQSVKTNDDLRLITSRVSQLIQSLPSGILLEDEYRRVVLLNDELLRMFGITAAPEDMIGADCTAAAEFSKLLFVDEQKFVDSIDSILEKRAIVKNEEWLLKDGRVFERDYIPIIIGDEYAGHLWNYRDVSRRKKYEREISELKMFYEQTLHDLPGQIAVFNANFRYLYVNQGSVHDPAIREWLIGKDDFEYCEYRGIDIAVAQRRRANLLKVKEKRQMINFEESITKTDGTIRYFERFISPIINSRGEITQYLAYGIDITEIKSLIKKLEYSNKSLSEFAYIASHDLREPLRKISAFGSLLMKSASGRLNEDDQENLRYMIDGAKRMQQMVDDLLVYSRVTAKPKEIKELSLDSIINEIVAFDLAVAIKEKDAEIRILNELGIYKAEYTQMKQLLQNLIGNALKYIREGIAPIIIIRSSRYPSHIEIEVEDNGIGISPQYKEQIFEMFKRLHGSSEYSGSGIGLAVCKKIVENYGGDITVTSVPDQGSVFKVKLQL